MNAKTIIALFFFLLLFSSFSAAAIPTNSLKIYAVTSDGGAISANLTLKVLPAGSGKAWSSIDPLVGTSTQNAERTAVLVAKNYSSDVSNFDYLFDINSNASLVEGPSAGAAMTALLITSLQEKSFPSNVGLTGTINEDGSVGAVGGVFEKSKEAARTGIKLFLIPKGESKQVTRDNGKIQSVDLTQYAPKNWGMKVVEVNTIDDVLTLAFSDISKIDVNAPNSTNQAPEFIPTAIPFAAPLKPMQSLTRDYLKDSLQKISIARTALSTTLLDDTGLISALLNSLNEAEDTVNQSAVLFDQNYFYSSANFAFLSRVNASLIDDISSNPSLLQPGNSLFASNLEKLGNDIQDSERQLDSGVPIDSLEWYVAAQERLSWAKLNYHNLVQNQDIVVNIQNGEVTDNSTTQLKKIQDYEFSKEWVNIFKQFYSAGKNSTKWVSLDDYLKVESKQQIVQAENALSGTTDPPEDIQRRLDAAKIEFDQGWFVSASFDAQSAIALLNAENDSSGKDLKTLQPMLSAKIDSVQKKIHNSKNGFVWANLYLDHARFYLEQSSYYQKQGQNSTAVSSIKSGIGLANLADAVFNVSENAYNHYKSIPSNQYITPGVSANVTISPSPNNLVAQTGFLVLLLAIAGLLALILIVVLSHHLSTTKLYAIATQLNQVQKQKSDLQSLHDSGKMDEPTYQARLSELNAKAASMEWQRKLKSANIIALDRLRAELTALERALRELKSHYREGLVVEEDYNQAMKDLSEKMTHIQHKIVERKSGALNQSKIMQVKPSKKNQPKTITAQLKGKKNSPTLERIAKEAEESKPKPKAKKK